MASMKAVNKAIAESFPSLDIDAVRGDGYVYFDGADGFDKIPSIYAHPPTTSTEAMISMCIGQIRESIK